MKKQWWHYEIAYQIYPKSFQDTNGDGIGDINGIREHLKDLKELGVTIIWLSPIFSSPMADHGYDISDYYNVDPSFGTNEDLKLLIQEAGEVGIKVLMDLVINHTSDQHEWFKKGVQDPTGKYGQYYIIRQGRNGGPPNNWRSMFGGSAWEEIEGTDKYYLHLFTKHQPDLNWENRGLRQELYKIVDYWMGMGISGFRVDAIAHIKKMLDGCNLPADGSDGLVNAWEYYRNAVGIEELLKEMHDKAFLPNNCFTIAEIDVENPEKWEEYFGDNGYFSTIFDFSHAPYSVARKSYEGTYLDLIEVVKRKMYERYKQAEGKVFFANFLENHDLPRIMGRFFPKEYQSVKTQKLMAMSYFFLNGIPVIYQGQEIGMGDFPKNSIHEYLDQATHSRFCELLMEGKTEEEALDDINRDCRENSRTPMQWDGSEYAGFTTVGPWFEVNPSYKYCNYEMQRIDKKSLLSFYKKVIRIKRSKALRDVLTYGTLTDLHSELRGCVGYMRELDGITAGVLANFTEETMVLRLPDGVTKILLSNDSDVEKDKEYIGLKAFQGIVFASKEVEA